MVRGGRDPGKGDPPGYAQPALTAAMLAALLLAAPILERDADRAFAQTVRRPVASEPVTASELVAVAGLSGMTVSPDGRFVAVRQDRQALDTNKTDLAWLVVPLEGGRSRQIASAGQPVWGITGGLENERPQWSPDSRWLYYRAVVDEEMQVWRASRDGAHQEQLTHDPADVRAFTLDTDTLTYAVAGARREEIVLAETAEEERGVLLDESIFPGFPVVHTMPVNGRMTTYRRRVGGGETTLLGDRPPQFRRLDLATRDATPAPAAADAYGAWIAGDGRFYEGGRRFTPTITSGLRAAEIPSPDATRTASVGPRSGAAKDGKAESRSGILLTLRRTAQPADEISCLDPVCIDADGLGLVGWTPDGKSIVFQTRTFGAEGIHLWDPARNRVRTLREVDGILGSLESGLMGVCQLAGEEAVCLTSGPATPPRLVAIDLRSGAERILLDPNPGLTPDRLGIVEKISISDTSGGVTQGWLVLPRHRLPGKRLPLVITSYTCSGFLMGGSGRDVPEHVLAGSGYAAVCLDFGGHNVRRPPGGPGVSNQSMLDMFVDAIETLDRRGLIDPRRVALTGFSGSASATTFAIAFSDRFTTAIVTTQGYLDPITAYLRGSTGEHRQGFRARGTQLPYDAPSNFPNSPALRIERITTPLLMQVAEVEYPPMMQLYSGLRDYGRAAEMWIFAGANHYKNQARQRLAVYDRNIDWIDFWLRGEENANARDPGRYERWREMRLRQCSLQAADSSATSPFWYCNAAAPQGPLR